MSAPDRAGAELHDETFIACTFRRTSFFDAVLDGCKMTGSVFVDCPLRPLTVRGGQARDVTARGVTARGAQLTGASLRGTTLHRTDLRRSRLERVDLSAALLKDTRLDLARARRMRAR